MSNAVYPAVRGIAFPVMKSPSFATETQKAPNAYSTRVAQSPNPFWSWQLFYNYLSDDPGNILPGFSDTDYRTLIGFMLQRRGMWDDFLYLDPQDDQVGNGNNSAYGQVLLSPIQDQNTGNWYSPIQRTFGGFMEDITDLQPAGGADTTTLYVWRQTSGSGPFILQTAGVNYSVVGPGVTAITPTGGYSWEGLALNWITGVNANDVITAAFQFYFRVMFSEDSLDVEQFMGTRQWVGQGGARFTIGGEQSKNGKGYIKFETSRIALI